MTGGSTFIEGKALVADFVAFGGRRLGGAVVLMIGGGVLEGVGLSLLVPIFALLAPEADGRWHAVVVTALSAIGVVTRGGQLGLVLFAFCLLIGVRACVLTARDRMMYDLALGFADHRRHQAITDLAHARWASLARLRHARVGHILSSETTRLAFACSTVLQIVVSIVMLVTQATLMIILSPLVAALIIALSVLGLLAIVPLSRRAAAVGRSASRLAFGMAGETSDFLGGLKIAAAHDMADGFVTRLATESTLLRTMQSAQQRFQSRVTIASTSVAAIAGAVVVLGGAMLGVPTVTLLGSLVVLGRMAGPVRSLQTAAQQLFGVLPAYTALRNLHGDLGAPAVSGGDAAGPAPSGAIRFEGVTFGYTGATTPIVAELDLFIGCGEVVGLAGPSGVGKTSFVDLLTGLLEPTAGRITVGGTPLDADTLAGWRRSLAYVAQDSYLTNNSIRQNLTWGTQACVEADLWQALERVDAAQLVSAMTAGLDTQVDERGTRLSGGERQRIALARAILRSPTLLILDEATNALDLATEQAVIANIRRALPTATMLIVAHRRETLNVCDRVITLDGGGLVNPGTSPVAMRHP